MRLLFLIVLLLFAGCTGENHTPISLALESLDVPAGPGSQTPHLYAAPDGTLHLTWQEPVGDSLVSLRHAAFHDGAWSPATVVATGKDWFVNWADFPAVTAFSENTLVTHFLKKSSAASPYAYDVMLVHSTDGGASWQAPQVLHLDGVPAEHGFVSYVPMLDRAGVVWLDGRNTGGGGHDGHGGGAMTLRYASVTPDGAVSDRTELDARVCDCCQTATVAAPDGPVVFYRDRSDTEIRDISYVRRLNGRWTAPQPVHADNWEIPGCPVNGPAAASDGERIAVAWFTAAGDQPRVKLAFSDDGGASFSEPVAVDEGRPLGRVDVALLDDGTAFVTWLENDADDAAIRLRAIRPDGTVEPATTIAETSSARASGFPRLARLPDGTLFFAWTEAGQPSQIRMARATIE